MSQNLVNFGMKVLRNQYLMQHLPFNTGCQNGRIEQFSRKWSPVEDMEQFDEEERSVSPQESDEHYLVLLRSHCL